MKRRWMGVLLALGLIFSSITVLAKEESEIPEEPPILDKEYTYYAEAGNATDAVWRSQTFSLEDYSGSYGAQLTGVGKDIYESMKAEYYIQSGTQTVQADFREPINFVATIQGNQIVDDENYQRAKTQLQTGIQSAIGAFLYDYPEVFWLRGGSSEYRIYVEEAYDENTILASIKQIQFHPVSYYEGAEQQIGRFQAGIAEAETQLKSLFTKTDTNYEKGKKIHDWICTQVSYDYEAAANGGNEAYNYAHTPYGVFADELGKTVVCEGYAKAFKILCDSFEIPSAIIVGYGCSSQSDPGEGHMWNSVQMPDSSWYGVDATWDDSDNNILDTYYAVGRNTPGFFMSFGEEHREAPNFTSKFSQAFVYPMLANDKYTPQMGVIKGDINLDGRVDASDLVYMLQVVSERIQSEGLSQQQLSAGDVAGNDQIVDANDLMKLLQYVSERIDTLG